MFATIPFLPRRLNHVVGYNEFYRSHLKFIMNVMQSIPKRNFYRDNHAGLKIVDKPIEWYDKKIALFEKYL